MRIILIATLAAAISGPVIAQTNEAAKSNIDRAFSAMDANKDGQIARAEFEQFMQARHAKQAQGMEEAFVVMDKNKDGQISKAEAAAVPVIAAAFDALDADKNGRLSKSELMEALAKSQATQTGDE